MNQSYINSSHLAYDRAHAHSGGLIGGGWWQQQCSAVVVVVVAVVVVVRQAVKGGGWRRGWSTCRYLQGGEVGGGSQRPAPPGEAIGSGVTVTVGGRRQLDTWIISNCLSRPTHPLTQPIALKVSKDRVKARI